MNEAFAALPAEKQQRIVNAAIEVFAQNEYKRASTDDIAARAGISKGLLFYYFGNKKSLYLYTYDYAEQLMRQTVANAHFAEITDFFELLEYAARKKYEVLQRCPFLMDFVMHAFYSQREDVSQSMAARVQSSMDGVFAAYCGHVDFSKFRSDADPVQIFKMLTWMGDGYLHEKQRGGKFDLEEIMAEFERWVQMFRRLAYREEQE